MWKQCIPRYSMWKQCIPKTHHVKTVYTPDTACANSVYLQIQHVKTVYTPDTACGTGFPSDTQRRRKYSLPFSHQNRSPFIPSFRVQYVKNSECDMSLYFYLLSFSRLGDLFQLELSNYLDFIRRYITMASISTMTTQRTLWL
jgi:hypothetical protein